MGSWFRLVTMVAVLAAFGAGCSAADDVGAPWGEADRALAAQQFSERLTFLRESDRTEELGPDEVASLLTRLAALSGDNPGLQAWLAEAGEPGAPLGLRVYLRDGSSVAMASRVFQRTTAAGAVDSRVSIVVPAEGVPFAFAERVVLAEQRVELAHVAPGAFVPLSSTTLAEVMQPRALAAEAPDGQDTEATSVEAINRVACTACRGIYGSLRAAGCGWGAAMLCGAAGISTAGPGLAICGAMVTAVCSLGLRQIRPLDPTLVCNWIGRRVSRDQQWCAETPRTCSSSYFDAAENRCDRCMRFAQCAATNGCRTGSRVLCDVVDPEASTAEGLICQAAAAGICRLVDRNAEGASRDVCRREGYCP